MAVTCREKCILSWDGGTNILVRRVRITGGSIWT